MQLGIFSFQISAQESRRKKKEYLDKLELRCERVEEEKERWAARCEALEARNTALQQQLDELEGELQRSQNRQQAIEIDVD